jgi:protein-tyrosine phosphatase
LIVQNAKLKQYGKMAQVKVLFVCLGNICRSPLAEGIFRHKIEQKGIASRFVVDSCGTAAYHVGEHPDDRSVANARKNGVEYDHLGRQLKEQDFYRFDYILAMDEYNLADIHRLQPADAKAQVMMMRAFDPMDENANVPDPYYGGEDGFQLVFEILERSTEHLLARLMKDHSLS